MNFGFSVDQAASASNSLLAATVPMLWIFGLFAFGVVGRMVFVAYGDKLKFDAESFSGPGKLLGGFAIIFSAIIFLTDSSTRALVFAQKPVDFINTDILGRDSCNISVNDFCVVVFEPDGRELHVNWHDHRVNAFKLYGGYRFSLFSSPRPPLRPAALSHKYPIAGESKVASGPY